MCTSSKHNYVLLVHWVLTLGIYYNRHNYVFRPLMLDIFTLYMKTYRVAIYHMWGVYRVWGRGLCGHEISYVSTVGAQSVYVVVPIVVNTQYTTNTRIATYYIMLLYDNTTGRTHLKENEYFYRELQRQ
jgi:hypothetical protein